MGNFPRTRDIQGPGAPGDGQPCPSIYRWGNEFRTMGEWLPQNHLLELFRAGFHSFFSHMLLRPQKGGETLRARRGKCSTAAARNSQVSWSRWGWARWGWVNLRSHINCVQNNWTSTWENTTSDPTSHVKKKKKSPSWESRSNCDWQDISGEYTYFLKKRNFKTDLQYNGHKL